MRWSKIKNIIILLLVIVNVSLLALVGARTWRSRRNDRETRERMIAVLEKNGVEFLPDEVPGKMPLTPCRITVEPSGEAEAALLLGRITSTSTVDARTTYTGARGTASFSESGEIQALLPVTRTVTEGDSGPAYSGPTPDEAAVVDLLSSIGVTLRRTGQYSGSGQFSTHTYAQLWNGAPVYGRAAELTEGWDNWEVSLRRLAGTEEAVTASSQPITAPTALARFLNTLHQEGYVCSQVTDMYPGYAAAGTTAVTLNPAWYIETDAWPWRFAVDAYSGEVTAVE